MSENYSYYWLSWKPLLKYTFSLLHSLSRFSSYRENPSDPDSLTVLR